jgi:hypothetical protein
MSSRSIAGRSGQLRGGPLTVHGAQGYSKLRFTVVKRYAAAVGMDATDFADTVYGPAFLLRRR